MDGEIQTEVERRLMDIRKDPERLMRYDANGDGIIDDEEWAEVRRVVIAEVQTERRRREKEDDHSEKAPAETVELLRDRFEVLRQIGRGGQGRTFLAKDLHSDLPVAVKELDLQRAGDWKAIELFEREARVLESLSHRAIPSYVDAFHLPAADGRGERFFLVQEFVDGEDFEKLIDSGLRVDEEAGRAFLTEMLEILDYLHTMTPPVIHRDIKPSNIIRRPDGSLALIDFGAVQAVLPGETGASTIVGTSGYMPLEQLMGRAVPATDLYGLAATMVHLLSHKHPADLPVRAMALQFENYVNLSPTMRELLEKMLAPHVEDRLNSAQSALDFLQKTPAQPASKTELALLPEVGLFLNDVLSAASRQVMSIREADQNLPVLRPEEIKSDVHVEDGILSVRVPRDSLTMMLLSFPFLVLLFFIGGTVAVSGGSAIFLMGLVVMTFAFVTGIVIYNRSLQRVLIQVEGDQLRYTRQLPHDVQTSTLHCKTIETVEVEIGSSSGTAAGQKNHSYRIKLQGNDKSYYFGHHLPFEEQVYIAATLKNALVEDPQK